MASGFADTPESVREISERMSNGAADVRGILSQLAGNVAWLRSGWVGPARIQFDALWDQWQREASGIQLVLTDMAELAQSAAASGEIERSVASAFDGIGSEPDERSDVSGSVRRNLVPPALGSTTAESLTEIEKDPDTAYNDVAEDDLVADSDHLDEWRQETTQVPWARFMTPAAWREVEAGRRKLLGSDADSDGSIGDRS